MFVGFICISFLLCMRLKNWQEIRSSSSSSFIKTRRHTIYTVCIRYNREWLRNIRGRAYHLIIIIIRFLLIYLFIYFSSYTRPDRKAFDQDTIRVISTVRFLGVKHCFSFFQWVCNRVQRHKLPPWLIESSSNWRIRSQKLCLSICVCVCFFG